MIPIIEHRHLPSFEFLPCTGGDFDPTARAWGSATPTVAVRNCTAYYDTYSAATGITTYTQVVANELRLAQWLTASGVVIRGFLCEPEVQNIWPRSETLDLLALTRLTIAVTPVTLPDGRIITTAMMHEDATPASSHYLQPAAAISFSNNTRYVWSGIGKAHTRNWIILAIVNNGNTCKANFDFGSGAVGTVTALASEKAWITSLGNGWYKWEFSWVHAANENRVPYIYVAEADSDVVFDGLNQDSIALSFVQLEAGCRATSYIPTAGAAATRLADQLRYNGAGNIPYDALGGARIGGVMRDVDGVTLPAQRYMLDLSDGGAATDHLGILAGTNRALAVASAKTAGNAGSLTGSVDLADGDLHHLVVSWATNQLAAWEDGAAIAPDTTVDPPTALDRIDLQDLGATLQYNGLLTSVQLYPRPGGSPSRFGGCRII